jgi:hypothetical protein
MKIEVTQQDIAKGSTNVCTKCPVARALRRAVGLEEDGASRWEAMAQPGRLFAQGVDTRIMCKTPDAVRALLEATP